ncbi:MAG: HD domain-containing protein [Eubacteriales bacterium]|nr:HD domain-containing protein [Eubacteriales bacterium]
MDERGNEAVNERLLRQIDFITEIDKLKQICRQNAVIGTERRENDAEHSWHMALMAVLLSEYSTDKNLNILRVIKMALVHDLVEIDAGDTYCYDDKGQLDKKEREEKAAHRLFNILPADQAKEIMDLWQEFEERKTPEAKFAAGLDRLQPLILNYNTCGFSWKKPGVTSERVLARNILLEENAPELWEFAQNTIKESIQKGYLKK